MTDAHQSKQAIAPLQDILDYLAEIVRLDGRVVERLSDYQLPGGQTFIFHQHELENLPGVVFNTFDTDGSVWLAVEALAATEPPAIDSDLSIWIESSADPDQRPRIRDGVQITVDGSEKDRLIATYQARTEEFAPAIRHDASADIWSARLHLEQRTDLVERINGYITGPWNTWASAERPRRRTMAIHRRLREMTRLAGRGADPPCEIVWGIGLSRWLHQDHELDVPLLERLVEIEILESPDAEIRIRPRLVGATINLTAFEGLAPGAGHLARDGAERLLEVIERGGELSPFLSTSFEPILSAIGSQLDPQGVYRPGAFEAASPLPGASEAPLVSDRWVIFARPRSNGAALRDIERLKQAIERAPKIECCLSGVMNVLLPRPHQDAKGGTRRQLSGVIGELVDQATATPLVGADQGDPFFPLPASHDQIEIMRQLERSDGLTVRAARGTDRISAIANIACHYLALGLRVLVVSRNETSLTLLWERLPRAVRELTINLIGSDKDTLRRAESVATKLQSIVETMNTRDQVDKINRFEREVIVTRQEISHLDDEIADIASRNLQKRPHTSDLQFDVVKTLIADGETYSWFTDRPAQFLAPTKPLVAAVDMARDARLRLADELKYIDEELPEVVTLPDAATLLCLHEDLRRTTEPTLADDRDAQLGRDTVAALGLQGADNLAADLDALVSAHQIIADEPWLGALAPLSANADKVSTDVRMVIDFARDASFLLSRRTGFLTRPVEAPSDAFFNRELLEAVDRLAAGGKALSTFSRSGRALRRVIDTIKVAGFAPSVPADWAHIRDYLAWRRDMHSLGARWRSLATEIGGPVEPESSHTFHGIERIAKCVEVAIVTAASAKRNLVAACAKLSIRDNDVAAMLGDARRLAAFSGVVRSAASRVADQRFELTRLNELFPGTGAIASLVRNDVLSQIGRDDVDPQEIERRWISIRNRIQSLRDHREDLELIDKVSRTIMDAGARAFARRIRTEPAYPGAGDSVLVADWMTAWNWAALMRQIEALGQHQRLRVLSDQRKALEARLRELFEAVVAARIHLGFVQNTSSTVWQALTVFTITLRKMAATCSGATASRLRLVAGETLQGCLDGIPCQIMPPWRVAEQLPARLGEFDLVVIDDASQSDLRELTAMLRGRKVLVTGEDRQTDANAIDLSDRSIERIEHLLRAIPAAIRQFLLPGASLCDFVKVLFPDRMISLREQVRRVDAAAPLAPGMPAQPPELGAPVYAEPPPGRTMAGAPDEHFSSMGGAARGTLGLEDEIATVAESPSLAQRVGAGRAAEPAIGGPPPVWLSISADSGPRSAEAGAWPHRTPSRWVDATSLELPAPSEGPVLSEEVAPPGIAEPHADVWPRGNLGRIDPPPFPVSRRPAVLTRRHRTFWQRVATVVAVAAMMMVAATAYWHPALTRLPLARNGAPPASALLGETALRKAAAESIGPEVKLASPIDDPSASNGSKSEPAMSHAVLIHEDPLDPQGKRYTGTVVWHFEQGASSGTPSTIKGDVDFDKRMNATLSLRRNIHTELPASHIIEVRFNWPDDTTYSGVDALMPVGMAATEWARSAVLSVQIAKVTPKFFMIALSATDVDMKRNIQLLKDKQWFYIPIVYNSGDRALLEIEKGADGERAFKDAFAAWGQ
jgi:hypothetical protein